MGRKQRPLTLFKYLLDPGKYWGQSYFCKALVCLQETSTKTSINKLAVITACWHTRNWINFRAFKYGTETVLGLSDELILSGK